MANEVAFSSDGIDIQLGRRARSYRRAIGRGQIDQAAVISDRTLRGTNAVRVVAGLAAVAQMRTFLVMRRFVYYGGSIVALVAEITRSRR